MSGDDPSAGPKSLSFQYLGVDVADGILRVTIQRPGKRNALSLGVLRELAGAFAQHSRDGEIRGAFIRGAGSESFAAGGDLFELDSMRSEADARALVDVGRGALDAIRRFPGPVVAYLNGDAIGGGAELAVACDFRIWAPHARLAFAQCTLNITPAWGGATDLVSLVGRSRALQLLCAGEFVGAAEGLRIGLADAVEEAGENTAVLDAQLNALSRQRPHVVRALKRMVQDARVSVDERIENASFLECWLHQDHWDAAGTLLTKLTKA